MMGNGNENFFGSALYEAGFYFSKNSAEYKRTFMKFQNLAAQVGGFVNAIYIVCQIIMKSVLDIEFKKLIINNIFDFAV